jgi:NAD/NADP transhydrogenase beta subunit
MGVGYADIDNPLFFKDNNYMLLGNSKDKMAQLSNSLREKFKE